MQITNVWRKASASENLQGCVEVRRGPSDMVQVRDSKDPSGPVLTFTPTEWLAFTDGVEKREFEI